MQVCTSLQTDDHASTPLLSFLQAGCSSCRPTNSVKALKAFHLNAHIHKLTNTRTKLINQFFYQTVKKKRAEYMEKKHTHPFNGPFSGTTRVSQYQKGNINLDFTEQETVSGSGISWAVRKYAPRC